MTVHIATPELLLLELEVGESCETEQLTEQLKDQVRTALDSRGMEQWSSVEIELFCMGDKNLAFAIPIKLYIPEIMTRILQLYN